MILPTSFTGGICSYAEMQCCPFAKCNTSHLKQKTPFFFIKALRSGLCIWTTYTWQRFIYFLPLAPPPHFSPVFLHYWPGWEKAMCFLMLHQKLMPKNCVTHTGMSFYPLPQTWAHRQPQLGSLILIDKQERVCHASHPKSMANFALLAFCHRWLYHCL